MKQFILVLGMSCTLLSFHFIQRSARQAADLDARNAFSIKKASAISCVPDLALLSTSDPASMIPLPGWGTYRWPSRPGLDSADFYFNQGMNMYYSFHIIEAISSFQKAAFLDPSDAMHQWGIALAFGPNINDVSYNTAALAREAAQKAFDLSSGATDFEKSLITAMLKRYVAGAGQTRQDLDRVYAAEMKAVSQKFPADADAGALYADALMLEHPWDLYDQNLDPKPWTPELVSVIEKVLALSPDHPGANHYYIHAVEASRNPDRALTSANKLGGLLPMVSHMVHMPSHIYIRTGLYDKGIEVNKKAIAGFNAYKQLVPSVDNGSFLYLLHNRHMQAASAMNSGFQREAALASEQLKEEIPFEYLGSAPPEAEYLQYMYMSRMFTDLRFGQWQSILSTASLPDSLVYARILQAFGKSVAYARTGAYKESENEINRLEGLLENSTRLKIKMGAFNTAYAGGEVARVLARGILAGELNRLKESIGFLERAVQLEDMMIYNEPKDWIIPPRQFLGAALLKAGENGRAEKVFREDLVFNPDNGWSLTGLVMSLKAQGKDKEAQSMGARLAEKQKNRNFNPKGPVF